MICVHVRQSEQAPAGNDDIDVHAKTRQHARYAAGQSEGKLTVRNKTYWGIEDVEGDTSKAFRVPVELVTNVAQAVQVIRSC